MHMTTSVAEAPLLETTKRAYDENTRVLYTSSLQVGHGEPEKIAGTVIAMFENNGLPTHRIQLDKVWPDGKPMIVGNVHAISLQLERKV